MNWTIPAIKISDKDRKRIGGKGFALASMSRQGFNIPDTLCVTSDLYNAYVTRTGLRERILLELHRKDFKEMRWEEIWDCATRIRNMFLRIPIPSEIEAGFRESIESQFRGKSVVVRSSAPDEDTAASSFAGLHESYLNIQGTDAILEHVRKVWASLWSDAALLYRQELGLDVEKSSMAVVIQEIIIGDRSGVAFSENPNDSSQGVIESVYGLNQGLVDGAVEPDRWIVNRGKRKIITHTPAKREYWMIPFEDGVRLSALPHKMSTRPPLSSKEAHTVFELAMKAEDFFKNPQDVEWTFREKTLFVLQSRPITTTLSEKPEDNRGWYLSLHRSFENLKSLRKKIEEELIPGMIAEANQLAEFDLASLSDHDLAGEIKKRWEINHEWVNIYWEEFIPFAHGVRLFGQVYNDVMRPEDPYEFVDLLTRTEMASIGRNQMLEDLANIIRKDPGLKKQIETGDDSKIDQNFTRKIEEFIEKFGDLTCAVTGGTQCDQGTEPLFNILLEMAAHPRIAASNRKSGSADELQEKFLNCFEGDRKQQAFEMLDLARASYQLRDDDNIYLGRIESHLLAAVAEARRRVEYQKAGKAAAPRSKELADILADLDHRSKELNPYEKKPGQTYEIKPRQLIGQPAGPGISKGKARVIQQHSDLSNFKHGEILVCDAVDPNMTFVIPLASAVVERRGGMLIHGAIIAREYGLPCVTGIPDATTLIQTGDDITVDGYLGIVTIAHNAHRKDR
ncbi:MAG: PEP/pyruvate-binding domain-containing protein [Desulfobacterales bacterium]|jgi:pyruvate,water dikinase